MTRYGYSQNSAFKDDAALSVQTRPFIAQVASAAGVDKKQVESVLKAMQSVLMDSLEKDGKVRIPGYLLRRLMSSQRSQRVRRLSSARPWTSLTSRALRLFA